MISQMRVAVFGSSQTRETDPLWMEAQSLGRSLAELGCTVVTGGYGGVMEAVSRGARDAGGHTIGLTVGVFGDRMANSAIAQQVHAEDLFERLRNFVTHADAFIVLHGGVGTLLEIALLWNLKVLKALPEPPVWLVGESWAQFLTLCRGSLAIREKDFAHITAVPDIEAAIGAVSAFAGVVP